MTNTAPHFAAAAPATPPQFPQDDAPGLEHQVRLALATPGLSPQLAARGQRLLERLTRPVQVVVVGPEGAGKSAVIDMLLGTRATGALSGVAMVELAYGTAPRAVFEDANGDGAPIDGVLGDFVVPEDCVSARQVYPHALLKLLTLTEVTLAGAQAQQRAILRHAVEYGDVILWCSQEFGADELALWAEVPECKRDSGFLVLTQADQQIMRGTLHDCVSQLAPLVEQSFLGMYPVAARQGLQAKGGGIGGDKALWRACGGQRLAEDLRRRVAQGRAATQDQAEAFLWQLSTQDATVAEVEPDPVANTVQTQAEVTAKRTPEPRPTPAAPDPSSAVLEQALAQLQSQAEAMLEEAGDTPKSAAVLDHCLLAVREMAETLLSTPQGAEQNMPALQAARTANEDGEEMLMLLQLEQDEDAAVDAVTLLLQLKKELSEPALAAAEEGHS
ncbi:hypothetical protein KMP13_17770 [Epibacterium ulvae]|uniref:hypothetical protein n=1 Tax=Epibacterium ulvae TaxID=1156985 RepID=UPI001BFCD2F9|nr:hypothetical protein [Epibacterium ulvae]MBT8155677.1 hypothetical protein [Epibacterium ulvae]